MTARSRRSPSHALTTRPLQPLPAARRLRGGIVLAAALAAVASSLATATLLPASAWSWAAPVGERVGAQPAAAPDPAQPQAQRLAQQVDELRMSLQVSQAHAAELERQVDALTQRVRHQQEELAFFRQAGGKPRP